MSRRENAVAVAGFEKAAVEGPEPRGFLFDIVDAQSALKISLQILFLFLVLFPEWQSTYRALARELVSTSSSRRCRPKLSIEDLDLLSPGLVCFLILPHQDGSPRYEAGRYVAP